ncbi:terpenoid synthase [Rhizopogon vinicolor AM-OR11-026]|uniref:Terpenoid synthase n=1 Tax=Rhizopogon vinicolor AM-OR11-026 TaxID=1314800 RepID=A0A1B7MIB1_9AGAM|nr:terpenoid synthase [Rhizopogon vinicolor AM-OR11-026]
MSRIEDSPQVSTSTLDENVLASIRQANTDFLQRCGLEYTGLLRLDEALYSEYYQEAINRGIPMEGRYSFSPYIAAGVAITTNAFEHLPDREVRMWICLLITITIGIDDNLGGGLDMVQLYHFNKRFISHQPQGDPAMKAFDAFLREASRHYSPLVSNLITTSILDFISTKTPLFADYCRLLSGFPTSVVFMIFPPMLPVQEYIQSMPDLVSIMNLTNDILSYYKEELEGDPTTYVARLAASRGLTKLDVLHEVIDKTAQAHHNILESLKAHPDAYHAYVSFFHGYIQYYFAPRYKLHEIMTMSDRTSKE